MRDNTTNILYVSIAPSRLRRGTDDPVIRIARQSNHQESGRDWISEKSRRALLTPPKEIKKRLPVRIDDAKQTHMCRKVAQPAALFRGDNVCYDGRNLRNAERRYGMTCNLFESMLQGLVQYPGALETYTPVSHGERGSGDLAQPYA